MNKSTSASAAAAIQHLMDIDASVNATTCPVTLRAVGSQLDDVIAVAQALKVKATGKVESNVAPAAIERNFHLDPVIQNALAPFLPGQALPRAA